MCFPRCRVLWCRVSLLWTCRSCCGRLQVAVQVAIHKLGAHTHTSLVHTHTSLRRKDIRSQGSRLAEIHQLQDENGHREGRSKDKQSRPDASIQPFNLSHNHAHAATATCVCMSRHVHANTVRWLPGKCILSAAHTQHNSIMFSSCAADVSGAHFGG